MHPNNSLPRHYGPIRLQWTYISIYNKRSNINKSINYKGSKKFSYGSSENEQNWQLNGVEHSILGLTIRKKLVYFVSQSLGMKYLQKQTYRGQSRNRIKCLRSVRDAERIYNGWFILAEPSVLQHRINCVQEWKTILSQSVLRAQVTLRGMRGEVINLFLLRLLRWVTPH